MKKLLLLLVFGVAFGPMVTVRAQPGAPTGQTAASAPPSVTPQTQPTAGACQYTGSHTATIELTVSPTGSPQNAAVAVSSGDECLDQQALKTVAGYHFQPAIRDGKPVATHVRIQINFKR